jgi:hypothetical protein
MLFTYALSYALLNKAIRFELQPPSVESKRKLLVDGSLHWRHNYFRATIDSEIVIMLE